MRFKFGIKYRGLSFPILNTSKVRNEMQIEIQFKGVMIPGLESIPESDSEYFSEFNDSNSNSNFSKYRILYCTGIDKKSDSLSWLLFQFRFQNKTDFVLVFNIYRKLQH